MRAIAKRFTFEAAHFLPQYDGPCARPHGHSYKLEVAVTARDGLMHAGMIMDFSELKRVVSRLVVEPLDHQLLNELPELEGFPIHQPTAENMVEWMRMRLFGAFPVGVALAWIRLWETEGSYCEWRP